MELLYGVMLCMLFGADAMDNDSSESAISRHHVLADNENINTENAGVDDDNNNNNERHRYESITINKPVMRFDYNGRMAAPSAQDETPPEGARRQQQFEDEITGPPSAPSVRCFCNLPACVSTGYMCKSYIGGCFSDLNQSSSSKNAYRGRHGCIEQLSDKAQRERCQRLPNGNRYPASRRTSTSFSKSIDVHPRPPVHCCHEDLCNHADNAETKDLINDTALGDSIADTRVVGSHMDTGYSDSDVWFKAATIAVPICGAVILFVLIAMAIRLLKTESLNNTNYKLGCSYQHYCRPASEPFLRKDPSAILHEQQHSDVVYAPRRTLPAPIVLTKNINERINSNTNSSNNKQHYNYNLLPIRNNNEIVAKFYENKNLSVSTAHVSLAPNHRFLEDATKRNNLLQAPVTIPIDDGVCDIPKTAEKPPESDYQS